MFFRNTVHSSILWVSKRNQCGRNIIFQWKVYERVIFPVKNVNDVLMSQILQRGTVHGKISHLNLTLKITGLHHLSKQAKLNQCLKIFDPMVDWPYRLALGVHLSSHFL